MYVRARNEVRSTIRLPPCLLATHQALLDDPGVEHSAFDHASQRIGTPHVQNATVSYFLSFLFPTLHLCHFEDGLVTKRRAAVREGCKNPGP